MEARDLKPTLAYAATADFYPADAPDGMVEWTFLVPATADFGAGVFEIKHVRNLSGPEFVHGVSLDKLNSPDGSDLL